MRRSIAALLLSLSLAGSALAASPVEWTTYRDARLGYSVEVPLGLYGGAGATDASGGTTFVETAGGGQLTIFGAPNDGNLSVSEFANAVRQTGQIGDVTYSKHGNSWFVFSGYSTGDDGTPLIFYTKFLFNADRSAFAGFEISYPATDKTRYDAIVTRIEKSLHAPGRLS